MKVFLCYAEGDAELARKLAVGLAKEGLEIWFDQFEVFPGDNWAELTAKALNDSEGMVVLYTPRAVGSEAVQRSVGFALGNERYRDRVVPVVVDPTPLDAVPWALRARAVRLTQADALEGAFKEIAQALTVPA